jgi:hypothetical protein
MRSLGWLAGLALLTTASAAPVAFRLASLPASVEPGQRLVLCAANVGTGALDVTLEFVNISSGGMVAEKTVKLQPLGSATAPAPCVITTDEAVTGGAASTGPAMVVGVALIRRYPFAFRQAQLTASIQVLAPDGNGGMRTVQTIPLSRTNHPEDGAPVYAPAAADSGHHK